MTSISGWNRAADNPGKVEWKHNRFIKPKQ